MRIKFNDVRFFCLGIVITEGSYWCYGYHDKDFHGLIAIIMIALIIITLYLKD